MSQENVEVVAASLREFKITHRPTGFMAADFVWDMGTFRGWPDEEEYRGQDGFLEFFAKWTEPYTEWDMDVEDLVDAGDDRVVSVVRQRGRLRGADSWVELRFGIVYTLAERLIRRMQLFTTPAEALEAVGLRDQTMSRENVEVVRRAAAAFRRADPDALIATMHPDVVFEENDPTFGFVGLDSAYHGHAGVRRWLEAAHEPWEELEAQIEEITPVGEDVVLVAVRLRGKGSASGIAVDIPMFQVFGFREGRIVKRRMYRDRGHALKASGLPE